VLHVQVAILRLDLLLFESCTLDPALQKRGLPVSDDALSAGQLLLLVKESTEGFRDRRPCGRCVEGQAGNTCRVGRRGWRSGRLARDRLQRRLLPKPRARIFLASFRVVGFGFRIAATSSTLAPGAIYPYFSALRLHRRWRTAV